MSSTRPSRFRSNCGEVLHQLDPALAEDAEVEVPLRARDLGSDAEGVAAPHQGERVAELEPLLRVAWGTRKLAPSWMLGKVSCAAGGHGHDLVVVVAVARAEGVDRGGREGPGPGDEAQVVLVVALPAAGWPSRWPDRACWPRCPRRPRRRSGSSGCPRPRPATSMRPVASRSSRGAGAKVAPDRPGRRRRARRPGPPRPGCGTRPPEPPGLARGRAGRPGPRSIAAGRRTGSGPGCGRRWRAAPAGRRRAGRRKPSRGACRCRSS